MREKWRKIGSPQTYLQKKFVQKFFEPLKVYHTHKNSILLGFSNLSAHPIEIENIGIFDNSELAIKHYINTKGNINIQELTNIFEKKFEQNINIQKNLINTGLRPITYICTKNNLDNFVENIMGKILVNIRKKIYENYDPPQEVHLPS